MMCLPGPGPQVSTSGAPAKASHDAAPRPLVGPAPAAPLVVIAEHVNRGTVDPGASDLLRCQRLVLDMSGDDYDIRAMRLDGDPWSKSRPRHTRNGMTYQRPEDRAAENRTRMALARSFAEPMTGNVAMAAIFYRGSRQRIDADNMLKHICDAATGVAWHDDSQVTAVLGIIELDPDHPRTVLAFAPHYSSLGRGTDWTSFCARCMREFVVNPKHTAAKYCGKSCADLGRGHILGAPVPCAECGGDFRRKTTEQKYCSQLCARAASRGVPRGTGLNYSICANCGKGLSHYRGGRCRECWKSAPGPLS